ncbi:hypothetical protein B5X24_HaOG217225 [Helicoverpa armigera]|uniref:Uncharacterized protein n=1 Tax=Helicoverpa armigera TaxID=29058 RepID=A0A2W1BZS9_HELAM|nr:hypothetical protein B5X24_HaOG217225 [Helicoverpa armigera]
MSNSSFVGTARDRLIVRANIIRSGDAIMTKPFLKTIRVKIKKKMRKMFINATRHPPATPRPRPGRRVACERDSYRLSCCRLAWCISRHQVSYENYPRCAASAPKKNVLTANFTTQIST